MEPIWITTLVNVLILFFMLAIPLALIGAGILLVLRFLRPSTPNKRGASSRYARLLLAGIVVAVGLSWLLLSFTMTAKPGQSPLLVILPAVLFILLHYSLYLLVFAGAVWLVLWVARRMGLVGPARESPLDILKARYARGRLAPSNSTRCGMNCKAASKSLSPPLPNSICGGTHAQRNRNCT